MDSKTKEFLQKLKDSVGLRNDYDFSQLKYENRAEKVKIIYKPFGTVHYVDVGSLLSGKGVEISNAVSKNQFAKKQFQKIHGNRYDYSKFNYQKSSEKSIVICKTHGEFKKRVFLKSKAII